MSRFAALKAAPVAPVQTPDTPEPSQPKPAVIHKIVIRSILCFSIIISSAGWLTSAMNL